MSTKHTFLIEFDISDERGASRATVRKFDSTPTGHVGWMGFTHYGDINGINADMLLLAIDQFKDKGKDKK